MYSKKLSQIALSSLTVAMILELFLLYYQWIGLWASLLALIVLITVWLVTTEPMFSKSFFFYFLVPFLLLMAVGSFLTLIEVSFVRHAIIGLGVIFYWLYLHTVYTFHYNALEYREKSIENISNYINLLTFFLFSVVMYAGYTLVGIPFWVLILFILMLVSLLGYHNVWIAQLDGFQSLVYLIVLNIIIIEVFWAVAFLPTNFYVAGFLVTMSYYTSWGMFKSSIYNILNKKLVARYLTVAITTMLFVILTTVWY